MEVLKTVYIIILGMGYFVSLLGVINQDTITSKKEFLKIISLITIWPLTLIGIILYEIYTKWRDLPDE